MSKRDPKILLSDILSSIEKIKLYVEGYDFDSFVENETFEIIKKYEFIAIRPD